MDRPWSSPLWLFAEYMVELDLSSSEGFDSGNCRQLSFFRVLGGGVSYKTIPRGQVPLYFVLLLWPSRDFPTVIPLLLRDTCDCDDEDGLIFMREFIPISSDWSHI